MEIQKNICQVICLPPKYMEQTDRQTDKSTHWNAAVFDVDDNWSKLDTLPSFVKRLHKQKEICKTTGNPHFQIHVECHRQVRLTQMCSWISKVKWKAVRGKEYIANSIAYTAKTDTAVPGTHQSIEGEKYYQLHELLQRLAMFAEFETQPWKMESDYGHSINSWKWITRRALHSDIKWANKLSNPSLRRMWEDWGSIFVANMEEAGSLIIEDPAPEGGEAWEYAIQDD